MTVVPRMIGALSVTATLFLEKITNRSLSHNFPTDMSGVVTSSNLWQSRARGGNRDNDSTSVDEAFMMASLAHLTCIPEVVVVCLSPLYEDGKKWSVAPESIAPVVGNLSIKTLHTRNAADLRDGPVIRLLGKCTCRL